jgi:uncharacterized protein (DUF2345 family)
MNDSGIGIRNPLFFIGVIEDNIDKRLEGRVKVRAFSIHGTQEEVPTAALPWAICASGHYDPNSPIPPLNSFVYGMFLDGREAQVPLVLGLIPSQFAEFNNPIVSGWGVTPPEDGEVSAKGSGPRDFGQPQNSRLARGESLEESYILSQELNRVEDAKVAGTDEKWSEPCSAYAAKYPYNRVIETAKHSIEIDDTPGAERIMVRHGAGSFIQMDSTGTTTYKSAKDSFHITSENEHVHVRGRSVVHIHGDSHVYTHGDKIEEINGNYKMMCRGNAEFTVAGQMNLNAGAMIQARASDIKIEANVGMITAKAFKSVHIAADEALIVNVDTVNLAALEDINLFSGRAFKATSVIDASITASNISIFAGSLLPSVILKNGLSLHSNDKMTIQSIKTLDMLSLTKASLNGSTVDIALGLPIPSLPAFSLALPTYNPSEIVMAEPVSMSAKVLPGKRYSSGCAGGVISADDSISQIKKGT